MSWNHLYPYFSLINSNFMSPKIGPQRHSKIHLPICADRSRHKQVNCETDYLHGQIHGHWILELQSYFYFKTLTRINYTFKEINFHLKQFWLISPNIAQHLCTALVNIMLIHDNLWDHILQNKKKHFLMDSGPYWNTNGVLGKNLLHMLPKRRDVTR